MSLLNSFPDRSDGICENAYIVAKPEWNNINKGGALELQVFKSQEHRANGKQTINFHNIPLGADELIDDDGYVVRLAFADIAWKTGAEVYAKLKTLKFKIGDDVVDLTTSQDV